MAQRETVPCPRLVAIGRNDPDVIAEGVGDLGHDGDAGRIHTIVIGDEDAQSHQRPPIDLMPPM
jgi:hypothetical protein